jgi:hypothetical protein
MAASLAPTFIVRRAEIAVVRLNRIARCDSTAKLTSSVAAEAQQPGIDRIAVREAGKHRGCTVHQVPGPLSSSSVGHRGCCSFLFIPRD